jgi:CRISPR/Cas system-associated exonuclease Cas4 (RecB family)
MKLETTIIIHATEDAKKKREGKKPPSKIKKSSCPSCELKDLVKLNEKMTILKGDNE